MTDCRSRLVDLTHVLCADTPPYPGDPAPQVCGLTSVAADGFALTQTTLTTHTGTHVDAPAHVLEGGRALSDYPLEAFFGAACVLDVRNVEGPITAAVLSVVQPCDWLLVLTGQSRWWGSAAYFAHAPVFDDAFVWVAARLACKGIGLDCAGLDREGVALHRAWFEAGGGLIVENLTGLERIVEAVSLKFAAVPLRLAARDGAPVRAWAQIG